VRAPIEIRLETRDDPARWLAFVVPVLSVLAALAVGAVFLAFQDLDPLPVYGDLIDTGFSSFYGITDTLSLATPLMLTGLAAAFAMRMNLYNIGGEGQLYVGAIFASGAALAIGDSLAHWMTLIIVMVAGAVGGALWMLLPAVTRAYRGASEIITTLLMTYVALFLMRYLIFGSNSSWRDPDSSNFPQGEEIPAGAQLAEFGSTRVTWAIGVAAAMVLMVWIVNRFTRFGYDMSVLAGSEHAAVYAGIPVRRMVLFVLLISGALAGLAGSTEVTARAHALDPNSLELGLGYTGIVIAALARTNPFGVALAAILIGGVENAGLSMQGSAQGVPIAISQMLEGAILLFALGGEVFRRNRLVIRRRVLTAESPA
jgi:ABC-type uncharacterized transport system permease subunit